MRDSLRILIVLGLIIGGISGVLWLGVAVPPPVFLPASIAARLEKIERLLLSRGCPECGAGGNDDDEPTIRWVRPEEAGKPCTACGVVPRVIRTRPVRLGDDSGGATRS